jgi:hypothetical protein
VGTQNNQALSGILVVQLPQLLVLWGETCRQEIVPVRKVISWSGNADLSSRPRESRGKDLLVKLLQPILQ